MGIQIAGRLKEDGKRDRGQVEGGWEKRKGAG